MGPTLTSRLPFLLAVALIGAALADPVVESLSNAGVFGGHYADNNHLGVVPTLLAGVLLVLEIAAARCLDVWRRARSKSRDWLVDVARVVLTGSPAQDFPYVFTLQLVALFLMEGSEQLLAGGRIHIAGAEWLGGPIAFSLLTHALIGGGCMLLLKCFMRAILTTFASLVKIAIQFILITRALGKPGTLLRRSGEPGYRVAQSPHVRQIGGRAPPLLQTQA